MVYLVGKLTKRDNDMFRNIALGLLIVLFCGNSASAYDELYQAFVEYASGEDETVSSRYANYLNMDEIKSKKCYICHKGKSRKNRNFYGTLLDERIDIIDVRAKPARIEFSKEQFKYILIQLESQKTSDGITSYGELFSNGELPDQD
jgi:hypothetical protein